MKQYYFNNSSSKNEFQLFLEDSTASAANLYTAFKASYTDIDADALTARVVCEANGTNFARATEVAGTNKSIVKHKPNYIPFAKRGCKYAGVVTGLSDADQELSVYQYIALPSGKFFVWGIMNSTRTDFYTPNLCASGIKHILFE